MLECVERERKEELGVRSREEEILILRKRGWSDDALAIGEVGELCHFVFISIPRFYVGRVEDFIVGFTLYAILKMYIRVSC